MVSAVAEINSRCLLRKRLLRRIYIHLPPNSMKLQILFNSQPRYFHQFSHGRVRGLLGWVRSNNKNILVFDLETCDEKWNWKHAGHFQFPDIRDVRAVLDDFCEVVRRHARGE